eukprot:m.143562 g.143562  ORF g.143562 m.143562 type:complete len:119 (-) comp14099_c0_seq4:98-454(-)
MWLPQFPTLQVVPSHAIHPFSQKHTLYLLVSVVDTSVTHTFTHDLRTLMVATLSSTASDQPPPAHWFWVHACGRFVPFSLSDSTALEAALGADDATKQSGTTFLRLLDERSKSHFISV